MSYSIDGAFAKDSPEFAEQKAAIVAETARRLSRIGADVLKMEFPVDQNHNADLDDWYSACQQISAASAVPWVLLSAGVDFDTFERQLAVACESGASGFLAGRAIWKECAVMPFAERQTFLETTATHRLQRLIALAQDKARPWTDFYSVQVSTADWFESYF